MELSEKMLWQALVDRDSRYDGICFYGVITTGVYCRPNCSSRKPLRENVRFFFSVEAAEKAGFRPCKRCHPERTDDKGIDKPLSTVLTLCRYIESCDYVPTLNELSGKVNMSPFHLQRVFKKVMGISPRNYADAHRQKRLRKALQDGGEIADATYDAGYGSSSRLYEKSSRYLGMTPKAYKDRGKEQKITYSTVACPLGFVLVAATKRGICAVRIGTSKEVLATELEKEFKNAVINENNADLLKWSQLLIDYITGTIPWPKLPYDVKATAFQRKIWDHLRTIPEGQTAHYGDIASAIGKPKAARAVARACATNPVALVVPCHRVVPKTGGVGGYRWGSKHKKRLLEMEKQKPNVDLL